MIKGRLFQLGVEFVSPIIVGGGLGYALDKHWSYSPCGVVGLSILGFISGLWNILKVTQSLKEDGIEDKKHD